MNDRALPDLRELNAASSALETQPATSAIEWAVERFGDGLVLASSFQDCVLIDLAAQVVPDLHVVFLDTHYPFAETLWYVETVRRRHDPNLRTREPDVTPDHRRLHDP